MSLAQKAGHVGVFDWDLLSGKVVWTPEQEELFGLPNGSFEQTYDGWAKRVHPEDLARLTPSDGNRGGYQLTLEFIHPDGTHKWISAHGEAIRDVSGNISQLVGTAQDITKRVRAEEALRASEAKFRIVADNTYDWEFWLSPQGEYLYTSPSCLRITGHTAEEFQADPELLFRIIPPEDLAAHLQHRAYCNQAKIPEEIEFRVIRPDGTERWIAHVCQPVFSQEGHFLGTRGSNRDVTKLERIESERERLLQETRAAKEMAENANKAKEQFIAVLSHELRTPLTPVLATVTALEHQSDYRHSTGNAPPRLQCL